MTRLFNRLYALCSLAVCVTLVSAWFLASRKFSHVIPLASKKFYTANTFDRRLVVFGDSWSDNNTAEAQGQVWTDWLCSMFSCHQENLAQTASASLLWGRYVGAVVDNDEEFGLLGRLSQRRVADFKTQVQRWLEAESQTKGLSKEDIRTRQDSTIFVVSFGVWDIWGLVAKKDYEHAVISVRRRIGTLMDQLNILSERWGSTELKVILTQTVDVTFLPAFRSVGEQYKDAVRIFEDWNKQLCVEVRDWDRGTIYLFDTNAFMMDRIRDWQLSAAGIEVNELGQNLDPGWENVTGPCVESGMRVMMSKNKNKKQCEHPDKYLFWNEMHLGPSAHRLLATEVHHGIEGVLLSKREEPSLPDDERHSRRGPAA